MTTLAMAAALLLWWTGSGPSNTGHGGGDTVVLHCPPFPTLATPATSVTPAQRQELDDLRGEIVINGKVAAEYMNSDDTQLPVGHLPEYQALKLYVTLCVDPDLSERGKTFARGLEAYKRRYPASPWISVLEAVRAHPPVPTRDP